MEDNNPMNFEFTRVMPKNIYRIPNIPFYHSAWVYSPYNVLAGGPPLRHRKTQRSPPQRYDFFETSFDIVQIPAVPLKLHLKDAPQAPISRMPLRSNHGKVLLREAPFSSFRLRSYKRKVSCSGSHHLPPLFGSKSKRTLLQCL